jgi:hypothetical protein
VGDLGDPQKRLRFPPRRLSIRRDARGARPCRAANPPRWKQQGEIGSLTLGAPLPLCSCGTATYATHAAPKGGGRATSLANLRRLCAIAPRVNSSCAPCGPRNLRRSSFRIRPRRANSISVRFRNEPCFPRHLPEAKGADRCCAEPLVGSLTSFATGSKVCQSWAPASFRAPRWSA